MRVRQAGVLAAEYGDLASHTGLLKPRRMQAGETKRLLTNTSAEPLHEPPNVAADAAEVLAPVRSCPDLMPVHDEPVVAMRPGKRRCKQREVWKRGGVNDVIPAPVAQEMPENTEAEHKRRQNPTPS